MSIDSNIRQNYFSLLCRNCCNVLELCWVLISQVANLVCRVVHIFPSYPTEAPS